MQWRLDLDLPFVRFLGKRYGRLEDLKYKVKLLLFPDGGWKLPGRRSSGLELMSPKAW
jgi:hypothetical protein